MAVAHVDGGGVGQLEGFTAFQEGCCIALLVVEELRLPASHQVRVPTSGRHTICAGNMALKFGAEAPAVQGQSQASRNCKRCCPEPLPFGTAHSDPRSMLQITDHISRIMARGVTTKNKILKVCTGAASTFSAAILALHSPPRRGKENEHCRLENRQRPTHTMWQDRLQKRQRQMHATWQDI